MQWKQVPIEAIPKAPGMTFDDELRYFYWCASQSSGRVVELGSYVGRSTLALAAGLASGKVVAIDCFVWDKWHLENTLYYTIPALTDVQRAKLTPEQLAPQEGDSFLPIFKAFTEPLADRIEPIVANLEEYQWNDGPIDVLMVDAAKSWQILDNIVRQFFPCLTAGAYVIHQDYKHVFTYWLHPVTERMIEDGVLTVAENIPNTATHGFRRTNKPLDVERYVSAEFSNSAIDRLMEKSVGRLNDPSVIAAQIRSLRVRGELEHAKRIFKETMAARKFADTHALTELLQIARDWFEPIDLSGGVAKIDAASGSALVLNYEGNLQLKLIADGKPLLYSPAQPLVIPLRGYRNVTLHAGETRFISPLVLNA
jgi:hypothetical protein